MASAKLILLITTLVHIAHAMRIPAQDKPQNFLQRLFTGPVKCQRRDKEQGQKKRSTCFAPHVCRSFYILTAVNPFLATLSNDHSARIEAPFLTVPFPHERGPVSAASVYRTLFYFAKLKPRVLFSIGGLLRALQLNTGLRHVFDPGAGIGAGINFLCLFANSRWPAAIVLGWAVTEQYWRLFGAQVPRGGHLPIGVFGVSVRPPDSSRKR